MGLLSQVKYLTDITNMVVKAMDTHTLDDQVRALKNAKDELDEASAIARAKETKYDIEMEKLIEMLEEAGKEGYFVDNIGKVQIAAKKMWFCPKSTEDKLALFEVFKKQYGEEFLNEQLSIHYAKVSSYCNEEEANGRKVNLPGVVSKIDKKIKFTKE
jgi:hypothetical protein